MRMLDQTLREMFNNNEKLRLFNFIEQPLKLEVFGSDPTSISVDPSMMSFFSLRFCVKYNVKSHWWEVYIL